MIKPTRGRLTLRYRTLITEKSPVKADLMGKSGATVYQVTRDAARASVREAHGGRVAHVPFLHMQLPP